MPESFSLAVIATDTRKTKLNCICSMIIIWALNSQTRADKVKAFRMNGFQMLWFSKKILATQNDRHTDSLIYNRVLEIHFYLVLHSYHVMFSSMAIVM